jgi:hypothetical protein
MVFSAVWALAEERSGDGPVSGKAPRLNSVIRVKARQDLWLIDFIKIISG